MANPKVVLGSYILVFISGVVAGKLINQDELDLYRSAHETSTIKMKRTIRNVAYGMLAMGVLVVGLRASRK